MAARYYVNPGRNASTGYKRDRKQTIPGRKWSESAKTGEEASKRARTKRENQKTPSVPKVEKRESKSIPSVKSNSQAINEINAYRDSLRKNTRAVTPEETMKRNSFKRYQGQSISNSKPMSQADKELTNQLKSAFETNRVKENARKAYGTLESALAGAGQALTAPASGVSKIIDKVAGRDVFKDDNITRNAENRAALARQAHGGAYGAGTLAGMMLGSYALGGGSVGTGGANAAEAYNTAKEASMAMNGLSKQQAAIQGLKSAAKTLGVNTIKELPKDLVMDTLPRIAEVVDDPTMTNSDRVKAVAENVMVNAAMNNLSEIPGLVGIGKDASRTIKGIPTDQVEIPRLTNAGAKPNRIINKASNLIDELFNFVDADEVANSADNVIPKLTNVEMKANRFNGQPTIISQLGDSASKNIPEVKNIEASVKNIETPVNASRGYNSARQELDNLFNGYTDVAKAGGVTDSDWRDIINSTSEITAKYGDDPDYRNITDLASQKLDDFNKMVQSYKNAPKVEAPRVDNALKNVDNGYEWVDPDRGVSVKEILDSLRSDLDNVPQEIHPTTRKNVDYLKGSIDRLESAYKSGENFNEAYEDYRKALNRVNDNMAKKEGNISWKVNNRTILNVDNPDNIANRFKRLSSADNVDDADLPFNDDFIMPEDTGLRRGYNIQDDNIRIDASTAESANAGDRVIPDVDVERLTNQPDNLTTTVRERSYHASSAEKGAIPEEIKQALREQDSIDRNTYAQVHNWQTEDKAIELWDNVSTFDEAEEQLQRLMRDYDPSAVPFARRLVSAYSQDGNTSAAMKVMDDVSESLTKAGRFTQSAVLGLAKDDPLTALRYAEKQINQINASGAKEFGKKWKNISLTDEEKAMFENIAPGDEAAIKNAMDTIGTRIGAEYPTKMMSKLLEARRLAMLFNMRTLIRNFAANVPTLGLRWTADRIEAIGQNLAHIINPDIEVNQSLIGSGISGRKVAKEIYNSPKVQEMLGNVSPKYEDNGIKDSLLKNKTMYKGNFVEHWIDDMTGRGIEKVAKLLGKDVKVDGGIQAANKLAFGKSGSRSFLETFRNLTYKALDLGDSPFVRENFIERLGSYIHAQGIKNVEDVPDDAIQLAFEEAMKATYKDNSWGYQAVKEFRDAFGKIPVVGKPLGEAVIPFVQAPGNIAARMVDYSPIRGTKGLVDIISGATKSDGDLVKKGIEELSKGLTGSAAVYAGLKLYESGLITGSYASDKDEKQYQKQTGYREWSLRIPGKDGKDQYIKFDWAQPAAEPIIVGALLGDAIQKSDQYDSDLLRALGIEGSTAGKLIGAGWAGAGASINSWFNASPLQGLQELMGSDMYSSASSDGSSGFAKNLKQTAVDNFITSFVPAQVGAIAKSIDPIQRNTNDPTNTVNTLINSVKSRIPVVSQTLPAKYDTWGREVTSGADVPEAFMAKNVLPGEYTTDMSTPMDQELVRLSKEANTASVFPPMADKKAGDIQLTNYGMSAQQRDMGQRNYELADAFINSDAYKNMNDADRANTLSSLYSMSKAITNNNLWNVEIKDSGIANNAKAYNDLGTDSFIEYLGIKKSLPSKGKDQAAVDALSKMPEETQDKLLPYLVDTTASKEKTKMWEDSGHDGSTFVKEYQTAKKQQEKQDAENAEEKNKKATVTAKSTGVSKDQLGDLQSQLASYGAIDSPTTVEYYGYAKSKFPNLTPKQYVTKLHEIGGDDYKIQQPEMLDYFNRTNPSQEEALKYWQGYGNYSTIPYVTKNGTWGKKKR